MYSFSGGGGPLRGVLSSEVLCVSRVGSCILIAEVFLFQRVLVMYVYSSLESSSEDVSLLSKGPRFRGHLSCII